MTTVLIPVPSPVGALDVSIASPDFPQALSGVLWRYKPDQSPDGVAGTFEPGSPKAPFGNPTQNDGKFFQIEGTVLHHDDNPPTPYQVVVTVALNGVPLHADVPDDHGTGTIGNENKRFTYTFQVKVTP
jgi:hypothetical protein